MISFEAFDLVPVMTCLKLDNMDAVQACMDSLEPWIEFTADEGLQVSINAVNGFIGGSVGVLGTVIAAQVKKREVQDRLKCMYCEGTGQLLCGWCLGTGKLSYNSETGELVTEDCDNCEGTSTVVCINCQGSGLTIPEDIFAMMGDNEEGWSEEDYLGLFGDGYFPNDKSAKEKKTPVAVLSTSAGPPVGDSDSDSDATR